jgi:cytochrome c biogenesis protein ResB
MKRFLQKILSLDAAFWLCLLFAVGSVDLAFLGATLSGESMGVIFRLFLALVLAHVVMIVGFRAVRRKRIDSALIHLGCACVIFGWLIGQHAVRTSSEEHPAKGYMPLFDGSKANTLGDANHEPIGTLPFTIHLNKFTVERYDDGPVREYRSRITILEEGKEPRVEDVRVNYPAYVGGYHIYQNSWGETRDHFGRPVQYTVLQFIRDPGLPVVYVGFVVLFAGTLWFMTRFFTRSKGGPA